MPDEAFSSDRLPRAAGLHYLLEDLQLSVPLPAVRSEIVAGWRKTVVSEDGVLEQYPRSYLPKRLIGHLRFAMRYEPLDLGAVSAILKAVAPSVLENWIRAEPHGKFARRAWYLYELLTGSTLDVPDLTSSAYVDLLDPRLHITGPRDRVARQRIYGNLLGNRLYCPLVRRTATLDTFINKGLAAEARKLTERANPAVLARAVHYLFTKETKSSFAIEGEAPSRGRAERFVAALAKAATFESWKKESLIRLQNLIVDPRYAQSDWRWTQNFIGQTLPDFSEDVLYVCPKPEDVPLLMEGWMEMMFNFGVEGFTDPVVAAAVASFGFVFIHPFEDGNGRIHRFLVHQLLARLNFTPNVLFPVSAAMLRNRLAYDRVLHAYSSSVQPFIEFILTGENRITVRNGTAELYRFFDATKQAEYLYGCIEETICRDLKDEIAFLQTFDAAMERVSNIVDMPNRRAALLIRLILQNNGTLSAAKRSHFPELSDDELILIEGAIAEATA